MALIPFAWPLPRSAYIHVPFCRHRCGYCNFSVIAGRDDLTRRYLQAIDQELSRLCRPEIDTIYIGGGTPTQLSSDSLDRLLTVVANRFQFATPLEWTVEANPEDMTDQKIGVLRQHGVNRISLGVQSFNDDKLRTLERGHLGKAAEDTIRRTAAQIPNVSLDLIFAAPLESVDCWTRDLATALSLPIQHLSTYALTYEKGTPFWNQRAKGELAELGDEIELRMYSLARQMTAEAGLAQYEISSFAAASHRCRHNLAYWRSAGWYGAGPGAARFVSGRREVNHRSPTTYLKRIESGTCTVAETEVLTPLSLAKERAAFGVRMIDGVDLQAVERDTGYDIRRICGAAIRASRDDGFITINQNVMALTERGILFADTVAARFLD